MKAEELYNQLERDFIKEGLSDDWKEEIVTIGDFVTDEYKERSMGLMCDFTKDISAVYTAVFPSKRVMEEVLKKSKGKELLFVHHPVDWDIRKAPDVFIQIDRELLEKFKEKEIAIYNLHSPLDNYSDYSTSTTLLRAVGATPLETFAPYCGGVCGVFGETKVESVSDLKKETEKAVNHKVSLYPYGDNIIRDGKIAAVGGGGIDCVNEVFENNVNVLITGITTKSPRYKEYHDFAEANKVNIIGATHYSTEKFACMKMVDYFKEKGLDAEFIEDFPVLEDM